MPISISPNLPANVVEIGNEITQAKIDEINAGTLALQTWVSASYLTSATASSTYAPKASPTFTGTVTIPAGASISGYLTTASASSTYQTQAGMSSYLTTASASSTYQTQAGMSSYLTTASASSTYAPKASPTFTGTVTIPAGASISGYLTTSSASSTYQTISGMSTYATQTYVTSQGYLTDAPSNGSEYVRKNGAWSVATGGGGGGGVAWGAITGTVTAQTDLTSYISGLGYQTSSDVSTYVTGLGYIGDAPFDGYNYVRNMGAWVDLLTLGYQTASDVSTYVTGLGYITSSSLSVTNIDLTGDFNGYSVGSGYYSFKFDHTTNTLRMQDATGSGISISPTGITFADSSTISTAPASVGVISGGGNYTITPADAGKVIVMDNIYGNDYIQFSGTFVAGTVFYIVNRNSSYTCDIQAGMSYNLNDVNNGTFSVPTQSTKTLICTGSADFWIS